MALSSDSSALLPNCVEEKKNQEPSLLNESNINKLTASNGTNPAPEALEFISLISGADGNSSATIHRDLSTSLGDGNSSAAGHRDLSTSLGDGNSSAAGHTDLSTSLGDGNSSAAGHRDLSTSLGDGNSPAAGHRDLSTSLGDRNSSAAGHTDLSTSLGDGNSSAAGHRDLSTSLGDGNSSAAGHRDLSTSLGDENSSAVGHRDPSTSLGEIGKPIENPILSLNASKEMDTGSAHLISSAFVLTGSESSEAGSSGTDKTRLSSIPCTLTTAHHESIVSVMANSIQTIKASDENLYANKQMPEATQKATRSTDEHPRDRKTSLENISLSTLSSSSWSSSADTNVDCETGSCQGTEVKCRLCGKIVPKSNKIDQVSCSRNGEGLGRSSIFCDGSLRKSQANPKGISAKSVYSDGTKSTLPKKTITPSNYSTFSSCGRPPQPKGNRRSSIDVIYARDSSEPKIDKINAKRRLSRQTDISSIELMTLTEGNENDEATEKSKVKQQKQTAFDTKEGNIFSLFPELRLKEGSSLDSFPRVPFNSFETASSLEIEERLLSSLAVQNSQGRRCKGESGSFVEEKPDHHQQGDDIEDPEEEEEEGEEQEEDDEEEDDDEEEEAGAAEDDEAGAAKLSNAGENNAEYTDARDPLDADSTGSINFAKESRQTKKKKPPCKERRDSHAPLAFDWTSEALIIVALFVYLACKALRFLESFSPSRQRRNKK